MNAPVTTPALSGYLRADGRKGIRNIVVVAIWSNARTTWRAGWSRLSGQPVHLIGLRAASRTNTRTR